MHQAQRYLDEVIGPLTGGTPIQQFPLPAQAASGLQQRLVRDSLSYYYSGALSVADAVRGIHLDFYTWATVKLYYSVFYFARAKLALSGVALLYCGSSPYSWHASPGKAAKKLQGTTHKVVLAEFRSRYSSDVLMSQTIDALHPLDWLIQRREEANYKLAKFCEPSAPSHFKAVNSIGVRKAINAYLQDKAFLYAFDPDHAMLAYPIHMMSQLASALAALAASDRLPDSESRYLASLFSDQQGQIADVAHLLCRA